MTHSYKMHFFHLIWSTKERRPLISPDIQHRLYSYMGAIIQKHSGRLLEIGGMPDHVHLLMELSNLDKFTDLVRDTKAASSLWIHKTFPEAYAFNWQEGFGSFSVSYSSIERARTYIQNQEKHHQKISFEEEYIKLLKRHGIKYDERFLFG